MHVRESKTFQNLKQIRNFYLHHINYISHILMSIELTSFNANMYEEAVQGIKQIKVSNQRMREIRDQKYIEKEKIFVQKIHDKISSWLNKVESGYLDPQSVRKVKMIKEQLSKHYQEHVHLSKQPQKVQVQQQVEQFKDLDLEMEKSLITERNKQLIQAKENIENVNSIIQQTSTLVYEQGQQLDIIDQHMEDSRNNMQDSNQYLKDANEEQKKYQSKYTYLLIIALVVVACILIFFFLL